ncbi:MAG TPA: leucyl aminopeptidase [Solirubrobacterales bacterium]|nr:leucyl aminopeptidase [Solirubrobacterales bacterium]
MEVVSRDVELEQAGAEARAVALFEGEDPAPAVAAAPGGATAKAGYKKVSLLHPPEGPLVAVGLGKRADLTPERLRVGAALALREAARAEAGSLAWEVPAGGDPAASAEALVTGSILGSYRFDRFHSANGDEPRPEVRTLTLIGASEVATAAETARVAALASNRARELQNLPSNVATPSFLAERAKEIASGSDAITAEVLGPAEIAERNMGGLVAVSRGSDEEARLIVLRYDGGGDGEVLGLVGKAVTFDTGGISLKPAAGMHEMKMDMSGGAAVLEAVAAIAELGLSISVVAVVPSTENTPSGHATKPGDIITQYNGRTVEVNNTDAEGRLILADALAYCAELGADRIIDLATLTGAVIVALGSTYAGLISNDDDLAAAVGTAGEATGELAWRLPLHAEYKELTKGTVADLTNAAAKRKASTIYAGSFLEEFVDGRPWVHLDIAGTSWDVGREYVGKGATGYGVRLLVELARRLAADG